MEAQATAAGPGSEQGSRADVAAARAPFAAVAALTVMTALAASLALAPVAHFLLPTTEFPDPYPDQHQAAETVTYLLTFALFLPLALWRVPLLADRVAGRSRTAVVGAAVLGCASLLAALVIVRVSASLPWGDGLGTLLAVVVVWWIGAAGVAARALVAGDLELLERAGARAGAISGVAAALLLGLVAGLAIWDSITLPVLVIALAVAALGLLAIRRFELPAPARFGWVVDLAAVVLLVLAVPSLAVLGPDIGGEEGLTVTMHQNFFVAPASDLLAGGSLLVDTFSQYGVVSIAFIAGWFDLVGAGNGTLGLLEGMMSALVFVSAYFVVRAAGAGRALAVTGFAVATISLVFGLVYPIGGLLQHGAIRFGLPMLLLAATAAGLRPGRLAAAARVIAFAIVGLSSIWAFEAFAYTAFTFAAIVAAGAALSPSGERRRYTIGLAVPAVAACVVAQLIFAAATLAIAGSLPDWAHYLTTLREFLSGRVGDLTFNFSTWSPGLGLGAVYLAAAAGVALLVARRRDLALAERVPVILLAGSTAYGVVLFSYLVNRSADHIVPYVSLPAFMVVMISIGLIRRTAGPGPERVALGLALATAALMVSVAWSSADLRYPQSALAHVLPGGTPLRDALARLRHPPELTPGATEAEDLLDRYWQGRQQSLVLTRPDLGIEALAQTGRRNLLPLSNPLESSFVPDQTLGPLNEALAAIEPGELMLVDANALRTFDWLQAHPGKVPRTDSVLDLSTPQPPRLQALLGPGNLTVMQAYALGELGERFDARIVAGGGSDVLVVELVSR